MGVPMPLPMCRPTKHPKAGVQRIRQPTAQRQTEDVPLLKAEGVQPTEIAGCLGIGRASVYQIRVVYAVA